jgi:hypothetical protein
MDSAPINVAIQAPASRSTCVFATYPENDAVVRCSVSGHRLRLKLPNAFGPSSVTIGATHAALRSGVQRWSRTTG